MLLQIVVEMLAQQGAKDAHHLLQGHLAQGGAVHGTISQTQGTRIEVGALHVVTEPLQNVVCGPGLGAGVLIPLTCRGHSTTVRLDEKIFYLLQTQLQSDWFLLTQRNRCVTDTTSGFMSVRS